jgi:signal peptidase II
MIKKYKKILLLSVFLLQLDQLSKIFIRDSFPFSNLKLVTDKGNQVIPNFFYITKIENTGAAWGSLSGNTVLLSVISILVFFLLLKYVLKEKLNSLRTIYYSMLFAGILGNLIDRLFFGYVTDFLNFYIFSYDYPVFNIADIFIVLGVFLCLIDIARGEVYDM